MYQLVLLWLGFLNIRNDLICGICFKVTKMMSHKQ